MTLAGAFINCTRRIAFRPQSAERDIDGAGVADRIGIAGALVGRTVPASAKSSPALPAFDTASVIPVPAVAKVKLSVLVQAYSVQTDRKPKSTPPRMIR